MISSTSFHVNEALFSKDVLEQTSQFYDSIVDVSHENLPEGGWTVILQSKDGNSVQNLNEIEGEFNNSLINESLRELLIEKTKMVKEIIVARAMYGAENPEKDDDII